MIKYIFRRLIQVAITVWIIATITFLAIRLAPGDPASVMIGQIGTVYEYESVSKQLGLDRPLYIQYLEYVGGIIIGDLGDSMYFKKSIISMVWQQLPPTVLITVMATLITIIVGIPLGIVSVIFKNTFLDLFIRFTTYTGQAFAEFWLGIMLILLFSVELRLLPSFGSGTFYHSILPSASLAIPLISRIVRFTRSGLMEILEQDFIRTARSKGLQESIIIYKHAFLNTLIPIVTDIGLRFGWLLGVAVVVEAVFKWPGLGSLLVQAVHARDYYLIQGVVFVFAILFLTVNLLIDVIYTYLDPRISYD